MILLDSNEPKRITIAKTKKVHLPGLWPSAADKSSLKPRARSWGKPKIETSRMILPGKDAIAKLIAP